MLLLIPGTWDVRMFLASFEKFLEKKYLLLYNSIFLKTIVADLCWA